MIAEHAVGIVAAEDPFLQLRPHEATGGPVLPGEQWKVAREQHFARSQLFERSRHIRRLHLGHAKFAGRDVHMSHCRARSRPRSRGLTRLASIAVPGVTTRVISRFTSFLANRGSSIWSQIATRCPFWINRAM